MGWVEMRRGAGKVAVATLEAYICKNQILNPKP